LRFAVTLDRILDAPAPSTGPAPVASATPPGPTPPGPTPPGPAPPGPAPAADGLVLRGVSFRYGPHASPVVAGLDLVVRPGDHLAVVGPSGIGKSTLAALLAGVLRPQEGEVRLGGVPLDRLDLPRHRVLIPQEAYVFSATLR